LAIEVGVRPGVDGTAGESKMAGMGIEPIAAEILAAPAARDQLRHSNRCNDGLETDQ
jgi:hypothetical protein